MPINYDHIMGLKCENVAFDYGDQEVSLYALGVGLGRNPLDEAEEGVQLLAAVPQTGAHALLQIAGGGVKGTVDGFAKTGKNVVSFFAYALGDVDQLETLAGLDVEVDLKRSGWHILR